MALDVYREIPSVLISTALGLRPRAVLISTSGIFPVYRLKPCVNLYAYPIPISLYNCYRTVRHEKRVLIVEHARLQRSLWLSQQCYLP